MNTKAIIFDVDGVLVNVPYFFTQELQNNWYENAVEIMNEYYGKENTLCAEWVWEARELIEPYLERIWWTKWSERYFEEQFQFEEKYIETALIKTIPKLQKIGIKSYLWTDQEKNRAKFLRETLNFQNIFDGCFISCEIWSRKGFPVFWNSVKETLWKEEIQEHEIVFFDDLQSNIDVAKQEGIQAFLYTNINNFLKDLDTLEIKI